MTEAVFLAKDDPKRKWRSFWRHVFFILKPFVVSLPMIWLAPWLREKGVCFSREDEGIIIGGLIMVLVMAYGLPAALVLNEVWAKYKKVVICLIKGDKEEFLVYRDERLPIIVHLLVASPSLLLWFSIIAFDYRTEFAGAIAVFSASFIIALYWFVLLELEDPIKSPWLAERVPPGWLKEASVDQGISKLWSDEGN